MEFDLNHFRTGPSWAGQHPVSQIYWLPVELIETNDYNPNVVAPPEYRLLELSIAEDGYTQPIVVWFREDNRFEVVDGFHRYLIGRRKGLSHLPCVIINPDRTQRGDRIAATIRHNRARGKHQVSEMSNIVLELKRRNWSDEKIAAQLGMDADEVLRLAQVAGIAALFKDREFSEAWL